MKTASVEDIRQMIAALEFSGDPAALDPAQPLNQQGVDSLDMIGLFFECEQKFGVTINEAVLEDGTWNTLQGIADSLQYPPRRAGEAMTPPEPAAARPLLCVVHCVDAEGPLWESDDATRERLAQILGPEVVNRAASLAELRAGTGVPVEKRDAVSALLTPEMMAYKRDWTELDEMLGELFSREWREARRDDFGQSYRFNWFTMDHVGFTQNPRRRAMGFHAILSITSVGWPAHRTPATPFTGITIRWPSTFRGTSAAAISASPITTSRC